MMAWGRDGSGLVPINVAGGVLRCSNGGPQWRRWARLAGDQAARDTRGPARREFAGMFDCPDGEACGGGVVKLGMELLAAGPGRV